MPLMLDLPSKTGKTKSTHTQAAQKQAQVQTSNLSSHQASFTKTQRKSPVSIVPNKSLTSKLAKPSTSKSTPKHSLSFHNPTKTSTLTKTQLLDKMIGQKQFLPKKPSTKQNFIQNSANKFTLADKSKSSQPSLPNTVVKGKKYTNPKEKQSKVTKSTIKKTPSSHKTGKRSSAANATEKSAVKTEKRKTWVAQPALHQTSLSQSAVRSGLIPKSKISTNKTRRVSSEKAPLNNFLGTRRSSKRTAKSAAGKRQRCNSIGSQHLASKNKPKKIRPLNPVNQSAIYPALLNTPKRTKLKIQSLPKKSCPIKFHPPQLQTHTSKSHKPKPCPHRPEKYLSENSVKAATAAHTAPPNVKESTVAATRGTNTITANIVQTTPMTGALPSTLLSPTSMSAFQTIILTANTTTPSQGTTTLEDGTTIPAADTTAAAVNEATSILGTILPGISNTPPVPKATTILDDATSATNTTVDIEHERNVTDPEEYTDDKEDYDSTTEYEYDSELDENSTAIPGSDATSPLSPGATSFIQNT
ncbi:hypothetical protein TREES_T100019233 [Tupaia chinensis]|uniref:Uncharacterized protein n=1 Tax=Tupaia chinensis TaxID=246437 RepID=L9L6B5_TUPCH|nr:hypothetical protein TREES_T100019233 [Tupaia chinensis]